MVMKPGKHQRSKQRCQDLGWKVHDGAESFVFLSYTMHELQVSSKLGDNMPTRFYWLVPQYGVNNYCVLCTVKAQKENKNLQKPTTKNFFLSPDISIFKHGSETFGSKLQVSFVPQFPKET